MRKPSQRQKAKPVLASCEFGVIIGTGVNENGHYSACFPHDRHVANVAVVGSSPITRSSFKRRQALATGLSSLHTQGVAAGGVSPNCLFRLNQSPLVQPPGIRREGTRPFHFFDFFLIFRARERLGALRAFTNRAPPGPAGTGRRGTSVGRAGRLGCHRDGG